jgi:2-methylcitrate dehydratase PrpD
VYSTADLKDEAVLSLAERVNVAVEPDYDRRYPGERPSTVRIHLRNGKEIAADESMPRGDFVRPENDEVWRDKLETLLGQKKAGELVEFVERPPSQWRAIELGAAVAR